MPHKTSNYDWDLIKAGGADFLMDDLRVTAHARKRLRQRRLPLEALRRPVPGAGKPVLKGNTVRTVVSTVTKPTAVRLSVAPAAGAPPPVLLKSADAHARGERLAAAQAAFKAAATATLDVRGYEGHVIGKRGRGIARLGSFGAAANVYDGVLYLAPMAGIERPDVAGALKHVNHLITTLKGKQKLLSAGSASAGGLSVQPGGGAGSFDGDAAEDSAPPSPAVAVPPPSGSA